MKPTEASFARSDSALEARVLGQDLAHQKSLVASTGDRFTDQFLGATLAIHFGRVDQIGAEVEGKPKRGQFFASCRRSSPMCQVPRPNAVTRSPDGNATVFMPSTIILAFSSGTPLAITDKPGARWFRELRRPGNNVAAAVGCSDCVDRPLVSCASPDTAQPWLRFRWARPTRYIRRDGLDIRRFSSAQLAS